MRKDTGKIWKDSVFFLVNIAIKIKPYLSEAYSVKANIYRLLFNFEAMEENYKLALEYDPNNTSAIFSLAYREKLRGNLKLSSEDAENQLDKTLEEAKELNNELNNCANL